MLKMTIDNEEVVSDKDITINEEMLSASSTILNNVYPIEWEEDKDYTSRFYYPQDYSKAMIQRSYVTQEAEAGTTIQVNGSATLTDVDTTKNSRVLRLLGQTSQDGTPTPDSPIPVNVVSGDNEIRVQGKNLAYMKNGTYTYGNNTGVITENSIMTLNTSGSTGSNSYFSFANGYTREWAPESSIAGINDMHLTQDGGTYSVTITTNKTMSSSIAIYFWSSTGGKFNKQIGSNTTTTLSISLNDNEHIKDFGIWSASGNIFTNYTIKVQLEKGSSASTYEPYIGNTYNIDLPVENLLPPPSSSSSSTGVGNMTLTWNTSNEFHLSGSATSTGNVTGGTVASDYTIKAGDYLHLCNDSVPSGTIQFVGLTSQSSHAFVVTINSKNKVLDLTDYVGKTIHSVFFYCVSGASADMTMTPMIVNGMSKVLSFTPYGTTPIELCKIGSYQDYIYKDSDKWYLHKEIGKVVLNGNTTRFLSKHGSIKSDTKGFYQFTLPEKLHTSSSGVTDYGKSNYFELISGSAQNAFNNNSSGIWWEGGSNYSYAILEQTSLANANTWLTTHNTEVYYALATSTNTEITDTNLLSQLNALSSQ